MKITGLLLSAMLAVGGVALSLSGCATDMRVSGGAAIHYGPFSFWFYDGPWLDGHRWWREGVIIHPPPIYIHPHGPAPRVPYQPRPRMRR
jgi:hypothetical protein